MKKFVILSIAIMAISLVAIINVGLNLHKNSVLSALFLSKSNVEAITQESNNSGSGIYFYQHRLGKPDDCILYKHVHINGNIEYSTSNISNGIGWTVVQVEGIKELCPKNGNGCTVYSCHVTTNTN
jgi:ABC-type antimicrobial peptide transport system permease subunit